MLLQPHLYKKPISTTTSTTSLYVEYAERGKEYGILFMFSLLCEYIHLECVRIHVVYRVKQAEYVIHIRVFAPQEYVNIYSTRRTTSTSPSPSATMTAARTSSS